MNKLTLLILVTLFPLTFLSAVEPVSSKPDSLAQGFISPPDSAKPQTWWHWMNGNITKAGITADLEAMKQIGLGGATIVNVDCGIPRGPVNFMSPEYRDAFKFAVQEASRLGLDLTVENCAGWTSSGGPWIKPEDAMQRLVYSETRISGPTNFDHSLPQPHTKLGYYHDIAVLAFPVSTNDRLAMKDFSPVVSINSGEQTGNQLTDGDDKTFIRLPNPKPGQPQFAQLEFKKAFPARAIKIVGGPGIRVRKAAIQVSDDDKVFRTLRTFSIGWNDLPTLTVAFGAQPIMARYWRVQFTEPDSDVASIPLAEIELIARLTIDNLDNKIGMGMTAVLSSAETGNAADEAVQRHDLVNLTSQMSPDGKLNWKVSAGEWVVLRLGYTPTGRKNHPAPVEGTGLECDKFSKAALDAHWDGFMQKILDDVGPLAGKTLTTSLIDSYEVGGQNWNKNFRAEFQKRRGYDLLTYLPTISGRIVDSPARTERFLWDFRRTIADLFAENYFGHFAKLCRQHGLLNAVEPYTGPFESLQSGAPADLVMGEFWSGGQGHSSIKLAASIAHIYGKTIVGAESFTAFPTAKTGRWQDDPYSLKTLGDLTFAQGLNRYIFHRYAMQPWTNTWPGMTMGQWGFHFERTVTWWNQGKPWIDYISRCQFLLQQGRAVADVAYFNGESAPSEMRLGNPKMPAGYDFDAVNADVLLHGATVKNGRLTLASGANYAALVLPQNDSDMTPQLLERIGKLVRAGATVIGSRPQHSPSLTDFPKCDQQVKKLADALWGNCNGTNIQENVVGKGRIVWGKSLADIYAAQSLKPDFEFTNTAATKLAYCHRIAGEADIYFVSNQRRQFDSAECTFRVSGKIPELWHPDTGVIEPAPVWSIQDGRTKVQLNFQPAESVFVIFRRAANNADHVVAVSSSIKTDSPVQPKLEIQRAVYAAAEDASGMDVTAKLTELISDGQLVVTAKNAVFGRDPAENRKKELRVDYILGGKPGQIIVPENDTLTLPETLFASRPPQWETSVAADGSAVVKVWGDGSVTLCTAGGNNLHADAAGLPAPQEISGAWNLNFPPNWGAPPTIALDKLISWTDHTNGGVRYFSGTASYEKEIEISADRLTAGRELWLDLGGVKNFAEVTLNGRDFGVLWKPPFRINVTKAAKPGVNKLVVKVTNLWANRLVGDEQLPDDREWNGKRLKEWPQWFLDGKPSPTGRLTFTTWHHWLKDSPLLESGLLGPVTLQTAQKIIVAQANQK